MNWISDNFPPILILIILFGLFTLLWMSEVEETKRIQAQYAGPGCVKVCPIVRCEL